ncbi:MAG TPA: integrase core domain-containing protein, partial [Thermoanaerobaculia bacterium]|nr:integrase core domain-containing protein [Thermoanaerobaculia bacterium]
DRALTESLPSVLFLLSIYRRFSSGRLSPWRFSFLFHNRIVRPGERNLHLTFQLSSGHPLNHWYTDLADARRVITEWMREYNEEREHGTLGVMPREFARSAMEHAEIADSAIPALPAAPAATGARTTNYPVHLL